MARLSVKSSMKTQSIKLNYKSHKRDFIKTSTVCFAFTAHQEVILIQIEYIYIYIQGELRETDVFNEDKTLRIF